MSAPGKSAHKAQWSRGSSHDARNQAAGRHENRQEESHDPQPSDCEPIHEVRSAMPKRNGHEPHKDQRRPGLGLRVGCTLQIRRCTTHRTPTSERAVSARANPPTARARPDGSPSDRVLVLATAAGEQPADASRPGGVPRILPGRRRSQPEPGDHDEGIGNQEHEEAEGHRRRQHASPALGVALNSLEHGGDRGRVIPPGLDVCLRALRPLAEMRDAISDGLTAWRRDGSPLGSVASRRRGRPIVGRWPCRILHPSRRRETSGVGRTLQSTCPPPAQRSRRIPPCG